MCKNKEYQIPLKTVNHRAKKIYIKIQFCEFDNLSMPEWHWMEYNKKAIKTKNTCMNTCTYIYINHQAKYLITFFLNSS